MTADQGAVASADAGPSGVAGEAAGYPSDAVPRTLLERQREVLEMIIQGGDLRGVLTALCHVVEAEADNPVRAAIMLVDADGKRLRSCAAPSLPDAYNAAMDGIAIDSQVGTCAAAAALRQAVVTTDFASDPRWSKLHHLPLALGLKAAWSRPIMSAEGEVLGTFGTYFEEARAPEPAEQTLVAVLVRTAALAIERDRATQALQSREERHRFLADLAAATQPLTDAAEVMATTARLLAEHLDADRCAYAEVEDQQTFVIIGDHTREVPSIVGRWPVSGFGRQCVEDMRAGRPLVVADVESDPRLSGEDRGAYEATRIRAVVCVPLHKAGVFSAAMAVHQAVPRTWTESEIELVSLVAHRCWEVLERARIARNLQDSEARYRTMVEANPDCVKLLVADGTLLQVNATGLRLMEVRDPADAVGRSFYRFVAPAHRAAFEAFNRRVCTGERGELAFELIGLDGTRRSMEATAVPLPLPGGDFALLAVTRDVSSRVAADRALAEHRARLDYAARVSGVGFWYCDLPFEILNWDARVKEHFFLPPDARVDIDTFYRRIHPEDRDHARDAINQSIVNRCAYDVVYRTTDPQSPAVNWIRALGGAVYGEDGEPIRFDGVTVDVSTQHRDQERMVELLDSEREQARLFGQVAVAARTIYASVSVESILGVVVEEARRIIGAHHAFARLAGAGSAGRETTAVSVSSRYEGFGDRTAGSAGAAFIAQVCGENLPLRMTRLQLQSDPRWAALSEDGGHPLMQGCVAAPMVGHGGANLGLVHLSDKLHGEFTDTDEAILTQLSQIAAVALENARLYERLREQDRRKDEFIATLAHELRNPLAPIRTGLHILGRRSRHDDAEATRAIMERQLGHLVRMVDDLLDVSRITLGKVTLIRERVDVRTIVDSALETTGSLIRDHGHQLEVQLPAGPLLLDADRTRLSQVVSNLLNNAAKYTPPGGRIAVSVTPEADSVAIRVSDSGVGVPADMLPLLFDMFTQVDRTIGSAEGGLGIGLTLVRRLVELHGGTVEASSAGSGQGCTFVVRLPLSAADDDNERGQHLPEQLDTVRAGQRVLVVDDNVDAAVTLRMLLELEGHDVRIAHTGPDAIAAAGEFHPDVVFLDIGLPGLNGFEVARAIRADDGLPQPLLVAVTGWGTDEDRRQAHEAGFDRHLVKPVSDLMLSEAMGSAAARR